MPPDVHKLRQRHTCVISTDINHSVSDSETVERITTLKGLRGNEVCIDGIIFDISSFDHPGGDSIKIFGGNDVTVQYKMIHPYHTTKHLGKMTAVGKVPDYAPEYKWDTPFEREIKQEVFKIVRRGREFGTQGYFFRAIFYLVIFFYLQYLWMQKSSYKLAIIYGISMGLIGLNVQHDANHGAASKKVWVNDLLGLGADLIGGSKWLWMEKHWTHHAYTNHCDKDPDGLAAEPFLILNNYDLSNPKRAGYHAYQAFYIVILLCGYWLSAIMDVGVIWNLQDRGTLHVGVRLDNDWIVSRRKYAISLRIIYIICNIFTPLYNNFSLTTLSHINVMGISGSLTLGLLFTLSHNFENANRDPTKENRETGEPVCWFNAQVETSSTYGGLVSGWLTGGLNFQVEHHLFPRMSSAWYPYIAPKVREICKKHCVRYAYYPWIWQNMISTLKYTHDVGTGAHWRDNPFKGEM